MGAHRLYGIFYDRAHAVLGAPSKDKWAMTRNGRYARRFARAVKGLCVSMPLPAGGGAWDAPTFRAVADRVECDYRPKEGT